METFCKEPKENQTLVTASPTSSHPSQAFSLVELSIVLVILGLLTGGILTGQSLIRAAALRSVNAEISEHQAGIHTFRAKYFYIPGDMPNATDFWGEMTNCNAPNPSGSNTQTCNGDGNGIVSIASAPAQTGESFTFWQHLSNAGLLAGTYTGISGNSGGAQSNPGVNTPLSSLGNNAAYNVHYYSPSATNGDWVYAGNHRNLMILGNRTGGDDPVLTAQEQWGIDTKLDDGKPGTGKITSFHAIRRPECTSSNDANAAQYQLSSQATGCTLLVKIGR